MKLKLAFAGLLALALTACAQLQTDLGVVTGSTITPQQILVAANSFDGLQSTAATYFTACSQKKITCQQSVINAIAAAVRSGRAARNTLESFVAANPGSNAPVSNYTILTTAISALQGYSSQMASAAK